MAKRNQASADASQRVSSSSKAKPTSTASAGGRATRGQSRDVSEPTTSARKRRGRAESVDDADTRPGRRQKTVPHGDNLDDVDEEDDAQEADDDDEAGIANENRDRSESVHTTLSSAEAKNIDVATVPEVLELLDGATVKLAQLFLPDKQDARTRNWNNFSDHASVEAKLYRRQMGQFELQREELTSGTYILPNAVFKALSDGTAGLSEGTQHGLHAMLLRINVIKMIYEIIALTRMGNEDELGTERLRLLESVFPRLIAWQGDLKISVSTMVDVIMRLTIGDLRSGRIDGHIEDFEQYFNADGDQSLARGLIERFTQEEMHTISAAQLQTIERDVSKHLNNITDVWSKSPDAESLVGVLEKLCSEESFEKTLLNFAHRRQKELEHEVNENGGVEAIIDEITQLTTGQPGGKKRELLQKGPKASGSKAPSKGATAALKRKNKELANRQKPGQQPAPTASMMPHQAIANAALDPELIAQQASDDFEPSQDEGIQQVAADNARQASEQSLEAPTSSAIMATLKRANEASRRTQSLVRVTKKREKWTDAETEQLDLLIRSNMNVPLSYSELLKQDKKSPNPALQDRRPEDLRFKARNVKTKLLRGGIPLEGRWDQVVLAKAQRLELKHYNIEGYRDEPESTQAGTQEGG